MAETVKVKGVIRNLKADTYRRRVTFSVSIVNDEGVQIGARGFTLPFGKTKAETKQLCVDAVKKALRPVGREYLDDANRPDADEAHLDFNNIGFEFDYPSEDITWKGEVPPPAGEGDFGP